MFSKFNDRKGENLKKKRIKVITLLLLVLLSTGCTKYVKDGKESVIYEKTGQTITANILCKPSDTELINLYNEHNVEIINEVPECQNFKITSGKYHSLWESILVKPLAWCILKIGYLFNNMGISVMVLGLLIRLAMLPISKKSVMQSENIRKAQPEINKIEKKYRNRTDNESLMQKSQETMLVYKKYNINPVSGCLLAFIQLPLFFAFLEAINRIPAIFEGDFFFGMKLGMTPWVGIREGRYIYILLIILIILSTYFSFKKSMNSQPNDEMQQQMQFMMKFMIVMICVASFSLPTAIALYWIVTNVFAVVQNYIINKSLEKRM